ncbi:MAG TPA: hypothetical protein H9903_16670 [Candidatus Aquabacterium excrementipullorum]|nr:hypothetical protein [Candidatus Aquabacterium excrementipullorum]
MASFFFLDDHPSRAGRKAGAAGSAALARQALANAAAVRQEAPAPEWAPSSSFRKEVRPPALFARSQPQWRRWVATAWHWLWDDQDLEDHPRVLQGLNQVKTEFMSVVWDLQSYTATRARESISQARSLRELWHLRADVFRVIAVHRGQAEAYRRLESLNRHFPVRITTACDQAPVGKVAPW